MIHTFGDSHCTEACGVFGVFNIQRHHLGPILCYSFGKEKLNRLNIKNYNIQENDTCIFTFGEIDCRNHINTYISSTNTYQNIIDNMIDNYFIAIDLNVKQYNRITVYVYNVIPPANIQWQYPYPYKGSNEERLQYVTYFNQKLKEYCNKYNYKFFDIYNMYADNNGYLNQAYSYDGCHLSQNTSMFIKDFMDKNNIILI